MSDIFDLADSGPVSPDRMTDLDWALACEDFTYHAGACDRCPGCHARRCNRGADGQVLDPKKPWICEGTPDKPHPDTLVPAKSRCRICRQR